MNYNLSNEAERDLENIFDFGVYRFGQSQSVKYFDRLINSLDQLCDNPRIGKSRPELDSRLRSFVIQSHIIFYEVKNESIFILRILHHSRDVERYF